MFNCVQKIPLLPGMKKTKKKNKTKQITNCPVFIDIKQILHYKVAIE